MILPTLKYLYEACSVDAYRDKLQEMILQFRSIYFSNPLHLYAAAFENNEYYLTLAALLETIIE